MYFPPHPFTYNNQVLTPVTTERYVLPQRIIVVNGYKSGRDFTEVYWWGYRWREMQNMTNFLSHS